MLPEVAKLLEQWRSISTGLFEIRGDLKTLQARLNEFSLEARKDFFGCLQSHPGSPLELRVSVSADFFEREDEV